MILRKALGLHLVSNLLYPCRRSWFSFPGQFSQLVFILKSFTESFQEKLCTVLLLSILFSGVLGWGFWFFFLCLVNNQTHFYSTARYLQLTTAEKQPFILPPLSATCSLSSQRTQITEPRETQHSWCPGVRQPESSFLTFRAHPGEQNSWDSNVLSIPRSCTQHMQWDNKSSSSVLVPLKFTWQTRDVISRVMSFHKAGRILLAYLSFLLRK